MSDAVSALNGRDHAGPVRVTELGLRGMITLRGELSDKALRKVCGALTGAAFPDRGTATGSNGAGLAWMSPDEVLVMVPHAEVPQALDKIAKALKGKHHLAVNVSDARAVIEVAGPFAREVLAKLTPVDLHPQSVAPGTFRRTHIGQVAAAFHMREDGGFEVICFRSVAGYAFDLLVASAAGGPVGHLDAAE